MSKSLKKLIDINRLREFKNKLVGTDSAYVQTGAVDQTVAGTKAFSEPIVGSVTGSSGSCTGNAASANIATKADSATKATQDAAGNTITTTYATKAENDIKANNSEVVHNSGDETIAGTKTFIDEVFLTYPNALMAQYGGYTLVLRNDGSDTYILMSDKDGAPGTWTDARPLTISNSTGVCSINGNAGSATNATYANWLRTSSHTDHLFHTEWDGSYFWTYVTAGDGGYRAVRVARSDSSGNADTATKLATARTIALSGAATGTATGFDGSGNIAIPVTSLDASKLTGTASVSTTGNAATATKLATARSLWGNDFDGSAAITGPITGTPSIELMPEDTADHGGYLDFHYNHSTADYTSRIIESDSGTLSINSVTITTGKVVTAATFIGELKGNVTGNCSGSSGSCTGNAATATKATQDSDGNKITTTYSKNGHTHDDRYYTEAEVNNLLAGKANSSHTHPYIPTSASCNKNWHWEVQRGQPSCLWGSEDGTNMYVYNPSDFKVNYANSAHSAIVADNGVDSQGENWIRFRNGVQICWAVISCGTSGASRWTYGANFSSAPVVTVCDYGGDNHVVYSTRAGNIGTVSCLIVMVEANHGSYMDGAAQCIAIGRWK